MRPSILLLTLAPFLHAQQFTLTPTTPDEQVRSILAGRTEPTIAAILDSQGHRILANPASTANTTTFDISAIAPTLTALLLQNMASTGDVALNDPAAKYLPPGTSLPMHGKKPTTLLDLATHTSGGKYQYSPADIDLLSRALSARANTDYESLLRERILDPLAMSDTRFDAEHRLRGTADDLLKLLDAYLGYTGTPLNSDAKALMKARRPVASERETSLEWQVRKAHYCVRKGVCLMNQTFDLFTNEGASTDQAFMGFDPTSRTGVIILSTVPSGSLANLGLYLVSPNTFPLRQ